MFCTFLDNFDTFYKKKINVKTKKIWRSISFGDGLVSEKRVDLAFYKAMIFNQKNH